MSGSDVTVTPMLANKALAAAVVEGSEASTAAGVVEAGTAMVAVMSTLPAVISRETPEASTRAAEAIERRSEVFLASSKSLTLPAAVIVSTTAVTGSGDREGSADGEGRADETGQVPLDGPLPWQAAQAAHSGLEASFWPSHVPTGQHASQAGFDSPAPSPSGEGLGLGRKPPPHCRQSSVESVLELNSAPCG